MERSSRFVTLHRGAVIVAIAALAGACTVSKQEPPSLMGPSGFALSLQVTAAPQVLPRDGSSMSTIGVMARNADGTPMSGRRLRLIASAGTLTASEVNTANDGRATVVYIAPGQNEDIDSVTISVLPIEAGDVANTNGSSVRLEVLGPDIPAPDFTFDPATPAQFELVTLDASTSTLGSVPCGTACSYSWSLPGGATDNRQVAQHRFQNQGPQVVTLTVTGPAGTFRTISKTVSVGTPVLPIARLSFSPTNPTPTTTVNFNASGSQGFNGATIKEYRWDFGGATSNGGLVTTSPQNTAVFGASPGSSKNYVVTLTVVDTNDQTGSVTVNVTVAP